MRTYKYNLPEMLSARQLVDMCVKADMSMVKIKDVYGLPHQSYVANYITKLKNQDPPFEGYEPFDKNEVIKWLKKDNLTMSEVAEHFGLTKNGLMTYCKLYDVDVRKPDREQIKKKLAEGIPGQAIADYYGMGIQYIYMSQLKATETKCTEADDLDAAEAQLKKKLDSLKKRIASLDKLREEYEKSLSQIAEAKKTSKKKERLEI